MCSDVIVTPPLRDQLRDSPEVLRELVRYMANRVAGPDAEPLAEEVEAWIREKLGPDYGWPGNYRELEQCVRNVLIRKQYLPAQTGSTGVDSFYDSFRGGRLTADEVLRRYCTIVYAETGSYEETARRLQLDRRTIKSRIDQEYLAEIRLTGV